MAHDRRPDVVRQVASDDVRQPAAAPGQHLLRRQRKHVRLHYRYVVAAAEPPPQAGGEFRVNLHRYQPRGAPRQQFGEQAAARTDLDHRIVRRDIGRPGDAAEDTPVHQPVLAQRFAAAPARFRHGAIIRGPLPAAAIVRLRGAAVSEPLAE